MHGRSCSWKTNQMGYRKNSLASLAILLLIFLLLPETLSLPDRPAATYRSFTTGPATHKLGSGEESHSHGSSLGGARNEDSEAIFGDEKRRVYTGPNPLHNR